MLNQVQLIGRLGRDPEPPNAQIAFTEAELVFVGNFCSKPIF